MAEQVFPPQKPHLISRITVIFEGIKKWWVAWSFIVYADGAHIAHASGIMARDNRFTDIWAKYEAMYHALSWLIEQGKTDEHVVFSSDNLNVINTMSRVWQPTNHYKPIWSECIKLAAVFSNIKFIWITTEQAEAANALCISEINKKGPGGV